MEEISKSLFVEFNEDLSLVLFNIFILDNSF